MLTEKPGDNIGPYKLLEQIGQGGFGVVYLAEQKEPVKRRVALKIIKLGMDTKQVVARFEAERQALALMDHPNIARILEAGATNTGRPYFIMELVQGLRITDYCAQHHLSTPERLDLFVQICQAVQHAHHKGIIHRDLKPSNILVTLQAPDKIGIPKIIDFGIAKATQQELTEQTVFTQFGHFIGTSAYMSPEQAKLGSLDVDTRSDIYSLGVLLYELLTGTTPFDTKELVGSGFEGMRRTIQEKEPPTPSTRLRRALEAQQVQGLKSEIKNQKSKIATDLDWIVMKCLEKDRARRYDTANGLAMDIERHLNNEPIVARPPSRFYEFQKTVRRHKFGFAATAAVMLALAVGTVVSTWEAVRARRAEREQSRSGQEARAARQDATEKLWASYIAEARAVRLSGQAGRHFDSLEALRKAAALRPSLVVPKEALLAARNEAIASMILPDIRWLGEKDLRKTREAVGLDPTLEHYVVWDQTGGLSVRRAEDDREEVHLPTVGAAVNRVWAFSPNGKFLAVSYADGKSRVWDWAKSAILLESEILPAPGFTPDGQTIAFSETTNIVFQNLISGERLTNNSLCVLGSSNFSGWLRFDPAGERLALFRTEAGTNVSILDVRTGRQLRTLPHSKLVWSVAWHPDGRHLATGCNDSVIRLWDSTSGEVVRTWRADCVSLAFNHRGDMLASSGWEGYTRLWQFGTGRELVGIYKSGNIVGFRPDDSKLAVNYWDGDGWNLFEVGPGQGLRTPYETTESPEDPRLGPIVDKSGKLLAFRTLEGMSLLDFQTARQIGTAKLEQGSTLVGFDENGENVILTDREGLFRRPITNSNVPGLRDVGDAVLVRADSFGRCSCGCDGWTSGNGKVCAITDGERCHFFRTDTFQKLAETGVQQGMRYCDINPDGSLLASGIWQDPGVKVWNTQTGALVKELATRGVNATVAFSPDGRYLVAGVNDEYCFWEVGSWSLARRIPQAPDNDWFPMMAFSRDGRIFAGTHSRNGIRLHDVATGEVLADLEAPNSRMVSDPNSRMVSELNLRMVSKLAFNHDGTLLAASESWGALRVWDLRAIRKQLAELGLDWDQPSYPDAVGEAAAAGSKSKH